jgi:hypothetical protein
MLAEARWDEVLVRLHGEVYRGVERISTAAILDALEVGRDIRERQKVGKRLVSPMRRLGWTGPKNMRCGAGKYREMVSAGYWRVPHAPPLGTHLLDVEATGEPEGDLPAQLEEVTVLGLRKLKRILRLPTDRADGNLLRAQVTAALGAINAQLRADEARLKAKPQGDVLERLLKTIEEERAKLNARRAAAKSLPQGKAEEDMPAPTDDAGEAC